MRKVKQADMNASGVHTLKKKLICHAQNLLRTECLPNFGSLVNKFSGIRLLNFSSLVNVSTAETLDESTIFLEVKQGLGD